MKILLVHAEDSPLAGPWTGQRWDTVFDLARSGWAACERWSRALRCPVKPIDGIREGLNEIHQVRDLLRMGVGRLVDRVGLDWWELSAIMIHQKLEALVLLRKLAQSLPADAEVWITRTGFEADALQSLLGPRLRVMPAQPGSRSRTGIGHYLGRLRQLPVKQVIQIVGDKFDAGYRVRRHLHRRPDRGARPLVLVPTSYVNISLTAVGFAGLRPQRDFLLVATRSSGRLPEVPQNVRQEWLAAYAGDSADAERLELLTMWEELKKEIAVIPELADVARLGLMDDFPRRIEDGLAVRDAWRGVLESEPIEAVLCCDDSNPHTHIPLLLAKKRGLPTVACHHGALDGRYLIKTSHADVVLAKSVMEQDYLVNTCGLDPSAVEIGAPPAPAVLGNLRRAAGDCIVFFSEPYEMSAGRTEEIYRDIIPGFADLAQSLGKKLIVKLHPSENLSNRRELGRLILTPAQESGVEWRTGRLDSELLGRTWAAVTVQSSVAVECAVLGIPCFLCEWLDLWPYQYVAQFRKFGVGIGLRAPEDIGKIPGVISQWTPRAGVGEDCWKSMSGERLEELLTGRRMDSAVPLETQRS